jgi:hypothetical protein
MVGCILNISVVELDISVWDKVMFPSQPGDGALQPLVCNL